MPSLPYFVSLFCKPVQGRTQFMHFDPVLPIGDTILRKKRHLDRERDRERNSDREIEVDINCLALSFSESCCFNLTNYSVGSICKNTLCSHFSEVNHVLRCNF